MANRRVTPLEFNKKVADVAFNQINARLGPRSLCPLETQMRSLTITLRCIKCVAGNDRSLPHTSGDTVTTIAAEWIYM